MISDVIDTFKGFKGYEGGAFFGFLFAATIFSIQFNFFSFLISICACVWVLTSSGWRQRLQSIYDAIDESSEVKGK